MLKQKGLLGFLVWLSIETERDDPKRRRFGTERRDMGGA
jgi:hypothetical protein